MNKLKQSVLALTVLGLFSLQTSLLSQAQEPLETTTSSETSQSLAAQTSPIPDKNPSIPVVEASGILAEQPQSTNEETKSGLTLQEYLESDASQLAEWIRSGRTTKDELITLAIQSVQETNPELNDVISIREKEARQEAEKMTDSGQPFYGVPILVKGLGHTVSGGQNTNGLLALKDTTSRSTGRYVKALQEAGFVVIGQTAFPEMGWINVTHSALYGVTRNPWNLDKSPGGSSGGASAAVASGQVPLASASDGGGSTRIPASWTGLIGFMPTIGITAGNSYTTYNQVSHFAETKSMRDTEQLYKALLTTQSSPLHLDKSQTIAYSLKTPAGTPLSKEAIEAVQEAVTFLQQQGYRLEEVDYPVDGQKMMEAYYTLAASNATTANFLIQQKLKRSMRYGDTELLTWALYQTGKDLTKNDLQVAYQQIQDMRKQMTDFYQKYPLFLTPTTAWTAPRADYQHIPSEMIDTLKDMSGLSKEEKRQLIYDQWLPAWTLTPYTQLGNLTQTPSISLPTYVSSDGLPLGILFQTGRNQDNLLLEMGRLFETQGKFWTLSRYQKTKEAAANDKHQAPPRAEKQIGEKLASHPATGRKVEKAAQTTYPSLQPVDKLAMAHANEPSSEHGASRTLPQTGVEETKTLPLLALSFLLSSILILPKKKTTETSKKRRFH
ncbi:amidase family protein [Streptococcus sp. DD13]|uniref:amidase family protein n=1 Tax=Streptococcus sp. DD13 TaxID=1777881 RepID=UPI000793D091|nr:amidase family protein [Streptococcus sp. DD13]KXT78351.1 6-aminohexanoate-cyclic-dimer hydrolase [Streptococcus sp. DD13]